MTPDLEALIAKGRRSLRASQRLLDEGDPDFAASRAYYAMFYAVEALLLSRGMTFSKHGAVIAAFGQHFVKAGHFTTEHHAALRNAFDERNVGDYDFSAAFPREAAQRLVDQAEAFVNDADAFLRRTSDTRP